MSKEKLINFTGWAFILGSLSFVTILTASDAIAIPGSLLSTILLAVGLLGLRARLSERAGGFSRNILIAGVIAAAFPYIGLASLAFLPNREQLIGRGFWILMFTGPAIVLLALTLFGLEALRSKLLPRWNWLPVVTGIWYPAVYIFGVGYLGIHYDFYKFYQHFSMAILPMLLMQVLALCAFGAVLLANPPQEMATA